MQRLSFYRFPAKTWDMCEYGCDPGERWYAINWGQRDGESQHYDDEKIASKLQVRSPSHAFDFRSLHSRRCRLRLWYVDGIMGVTFHRDPRSRIRRTCINLQPTPDRLEMLC